ncbi:33573_t:CDS:2, partial [Racocetra persica]
LKAQQEKSTMLSIYVFQPDTRIEEVEENYYSDNPIDALIKWELSNLKFYRDNGFDLSEHLLWYEGEEYQKLAQNLIQMHDSKNNYFEDLQNLIQKSLGKWAKENANIQEISEIIKAIENATENLCYVRLASFLDPRSKSDEILPVIREYALRKCSAYYLKNTSKHLDESLQAANKELECYVNRPQLLLDSNVNPYEWWQGSNQILPGLATLARECLPILA